LRLKEEEGLHKESREPVKKEGESARKIEIEREKQ
jgi:hypothetical protein